MQRIAGNATMAENKAVFPITIEITVPAVVKARLRSKFPVKLIRSTKIRYLYLLVILFFTYFLLKSFFFSCTKTASIFAPNTAPAFYFLPYSVHGLGHFPRICRYMRYTIRSIF